MHTLFAVPFTCSLAVHLMLVEYNLPFEIQWVRRGPNRQVADEALAAINPKRKVPTLVLPDGEVLTEIAAILLTLDESNAPPRPPAERRRQLEWLSFLSTELHKGVLAVAFDPDEPPVAIDDVRARLLPPVLEHLAETLAERPFLLGDRPSGLDAYLLWGVLLVAHRWPDALPASLHAFRRRLAAHGRWGEVLTAERAQLAAAR